MAFDFPFDTLRLSGMSSWFRTNGNRAMYFQPLICSEAERRTRQGIVFLICLACLLLLLSSCALPVGSGIRTLRLRIAG